MILPARVEDYRPAMLDELTTAGEVFWVGDGADRRRDGWLRFHLPGADPPTARGDVESAQARQLLESFAPGGAYFFDALPPADAEPDRSGWVSCPVAAGLGRSGQQRHLHRRPEPHHRRRPQDRPPPRTPQLPRSTADSATGSRGSSGAAQLTDHRGPLVPGRLGVPATVGAAGRRHVRPARPLRRGHPRQRADRGRRGRLRDGVPGAQRAGGVRPVSTRLLRRRAGGGPVRLHRRCRPAAVRAGRTRASTRGLVLAACDPANPYGAALPWPEREGHRPGRKPGALVILVNGRLVFYVERGGRTLLSFTDDRRDPGPGGRRPGSRRPAGTARVG